MKLSELPECIGCTLLVQDNNVFSCRRGCDYYPKGSKCPYNSTKRQQKHMYKVWGGTMDRPLNESCGTIYYLQAEDEMACRKIFKERVPWANIYGVRKCDVNLSVEVILHPDKYGFL